MFSDSRRFSVAGSAMKSTRTRTGGRGPATASVKGQREEAFFGTFGGFAGNASGGSSMSLAATGPMGNISLLAGLVSQEESQLRKYYRDMYYYDSVAGSAVDMISNFPYSEFSLTGLEPERIEKYMESMVRLNIRNLMPEVTLTYLVDGAYCASLLFDQKDKVFIDLVNYPIDDCTVEDLPLMGADPIITVRSNEKLKRFVNSKNRSAMAIKQLLPANLLKVFAGSAFELDTLTSLYVARKTLVGAEPTSWLKRVLPIYLLEKTLYRGTLVEAMRRQRAHLHVQMGDDTHEFTPEEMAETVQQFMSADQDPLGAVIGTRNNVQAQEIRQGGDFWKWTDTTDTLVPIKLRALGISEAFLAGDANYSNVETGMSVFMENLDAQRSFMTNEVLTNKVFPIVAVANQFFKEGKKVDTSTRRNLQYQLTNHNDLDIPIVRWQKQLDARTEENMMDTLTTLGEKGFPIPLRMWAAAAKIDVNALIEDLRQDEKIKAQLSKVLGRKIEIDDAAGGDMGSDDGGDMGGGDEGGGGSEWATLQDLTRPIKKVPLLARNFGEQGELKGETKTGKPKYIHNQRRAEHEMHRLITEATIALHNPNTRSTVLKRVQERLGTIPKLL